MVVRFERVLCLVADVHNVDRQIGYCTPMIIGMDQKHNTGENLITVLFTCTYLVHHQPHKVQYEVLIQQRVYLSLCLVDSSWENPTFSYVRTRTIFFSIMHVGKLAIILYIHLLWVLGNIEKNKYF